MEIEILTQDNNKDEEQKLIVNEKKPELIPFKVIKKENDKKEIIDKKDQFSKQIDKKINIENNQKDNQPKKSSKLSRLVKYRVQLGSFKNKDRAIKALENMNSINAKFFKNIKLEIYTLKKDGFFIHRVWTKLMKKEEAVHLCNDLKNNKINCILQVKEN